MIQTRPPSGPQKNYSTEGTYIHNKYIFGQIKSENILRSYTYTGKKKYNSLRQVTQNEYNLIYVYFVAKSVLETVIYDN